MGKEKMNEIQRLEKELTDLEKQDQEKHKIAELKTKINEHKFKRTKLGALAGATKTVFGGIGRGVMAVSQNVTKPLTPEQQKSAEKNRKKTTCKSTCVCNYRLSKNGGPEKIIAEN